VQKGAGNALCSEIAKGDFRRAFTDSFKRWVVRSKSLVSVPYDPFDRFRSFQDIWRHFGDFWVFSVGVGVF